tara:strand:+ start:51 stop:572 length:522 start_codon:yes stop_codon:yes gene_type:complete
MTSRVLPVFLIFVLGCAATLEDFYGMSRFKRADLVCSQSKSAREQKSKINQFAYELQRIQRDIDQKKQLLERGYRVHRHCRDIPNQIDPNCKDKDDCAIHTYTQICEETPVAINYAYEEKKLNQLENLLASASYSLDEAEAVWEISYTKCNEKVQDLSVKESFSYYESRTEPP